jgi:lipase ATG15
VGELISNIFINIMNLIKYLSLSSILFVSFLTIFVKGEGMDDFYLEHVVGYKDKATDKNFYAHKKNQQTQSTLFQRMMLMKMFRMVAPRGQGKHRIKYYTEGESEKVDAFRGQSLQKSVDPFKGSVYPAYDDPETVSNFAKMTSNAYFARVFSGWRNITDYDTVDGFGWDSPGLRGYIFVNRAHDIVIISFKGTSILLAGGDTVNRDKDQDNKMFSCCCGRVDISWIPVCGCYSGGYLSRGNSCSSQCLKTTLQSDEDSYFLQAQAIVDQVKQIYPTAKLWFTGHSLGGAVSNLMALANEGTSSISFDAPGDMLYAQRMGLLPEEGDPNEITRPIWNFGVSSDPIYMGNCNGITSSCYMAGYGMETACHIGHECTWIWEGREDVGTHRIDWILDNIILAEPPLPLPTCVPVKNCKDCQSWTFTE